MKKILFTTILTFSTPAFSSELPPCEGKKTTKWNNCYADYTVTKTFKKSTRWTRGDRYDGEWNNGLPNGQGTFYEIYGGVYTGEWKDNKKHGQGEYKGEYVYIGEWKNDKRHGQGEYNEGEYVYIGEWKNNNRHGRGVGVSDAFARYDGDWLNDKEHGTGTYSEGQSYIYSGQWERGNKHGRGIETAFGVVYDGEWRNGVKNGQGDATYANGSKYSGKWKDNKKHGQGTVTLLDGTNYSGVWDNGVRDFQSIWKDTLKYGLKILTEGIAGEDEYAEEFSYILSKPVLPACPDDPYGFYNNCLGVRITQENKTSIFKVQFKEEDRYLGQWVNNKWHGHGILTRVRKKGGSKYIGEWKDGDKSGQGTINWDDGNKYVGGFYNGLLSGQGTFTTELGDLYVGGFSQGNLSGQGTFTYSDGTQYKGQWKRNKKHGQGVFVSLDSTYTGGWKKGKRDGQGTYTKTVNGHKIKYAGGWKYDKYHGPGVYTSTKNKFPKKGNFYWGKYIPEFCEEDNLRGSILFSKCKAKYESIVVVAVSQTKTTKKKKRENKAGSKDVFDALLDAFRDNEIGFRDYEKISVWMKSNAESFFKKQKITSTETTLDDLSNLSSRYQKINIVQYDLKNKLKMESVNLREDRAISKWLDDKVTEFFKEKNVINGKVSFEDIKDIKSLYKSLVLVETGMYEDDVIIPPLGEY